MDRRLLAAAALALLLAGAGCAGLGPGSGAVDRDRLAENATYEWDTEEDVTVDVSGGYYHAVYRVDGRETLSFSRFQRLNDRAPLPLSAVAFRYPNGTVVGADAVAAEQNDTHLTVTLPATEGRFAYRVPMGGKELHVATAAHGSYEVVLPPDTRVRYPLLGRVEPGGFERTLEDGRVHLRWAELTDDRLLVRFYLVRDLWLFAGIVVGGVGTAVVGLVYFWRQLQALRARTRSVDAEREGR